ncbi:MAG: peptidoglycan DD-metalloendopeptidase family protein [Acidimicrobiales bacterium]
MISATLLLGVLADATAAEQSLVLTAPVSAPVSDPFRVPLSRFGSGNRGLEFATSVGQPVVAAAAGRVVFVGTVAYRLVVTVQHPGGYRTTYTRLRSRSVRRGDEVAQGMVIGTASRSLHFGLIRGSTYLDPAAFMGGGGVSRVWLVAPEIRGAPGPSLRQISQGIVGRVSAGFGIGARTVVDATGKVVGVFVDAGGGVGWILDKSGQIIAAGIQRGSALLEIPLYYLEDFKELQRLLPDGPYRQLRDMWNSYNEFNRSQEECTPEQVAPPAVTQRRIAIFVPGLGSSSASPADFDGAAMGYDIGDVVHFSYAGGRIPGTGQNLDLSESEYDAQRTGQDINKSAREFARLLDDVAAQNPGVPIDVIAHSQGGLVARQAIQESSSLPATLENLVTMGTPHQGSPLAKTAVVVDRDLILESVSEIVPLFPVPVDSPSLRQLVPDSEFLKNLADGKMPDQVQLRSIGSRLDTTVPGTQVGVGDHGKSVVVASGSHGSLMRNKAVIREARLAIAGLGPTCRAIISFALDQFAGETLERFTDLGTLVLIRISILPDPRTKSTS